MSRSGAWLLLTLPFLLAGCQAHVPVSDWAEGTQRQLLVTFAQPDTGAHPALGAKHHYRFRDGWRAPLHLRQRIERLARRHALVELDGWPIASLQMYCVLFDSPGPVAMPRLLDTLRGEPDVLMAQNVNTFRGLAVTGPVAAYDDPYLDIQYGERTAALYTLHRYSRGDDVKVGLIDSAVDDRHPDLRGQFGAQHNYVPVAGPADRLHGTAVAGVIAALRNNGEGVVGLAPGARLYSYGACRGDSSGTAVCNSFDLARAMEAAIQSGVQVLNMSLAGPEDPLLSALLAQALARGTTVIASRNSVDSSRNFPASFPGVIAAGRSPPASPENPAVNAADRAQFEEWLSTRAGGGYQFFYGSSIASAGLTGLAAVVRAQVSADQANRVVRRISQGCHDGEPHVSPEQFELALARVLGCPEKEPEP